MADSVRYSTTDIHSLRKKAARYQSDWREEARGDYKFRDGEQWNDEDKASLEEQGRPCVTFNRIGPIINSVKGQEINNRQEIRYLPRNVSDTDPAVVEVLNASVKYVRDNCDAEDEESDAYEDAITCGMGWVETYVDYNQDPDGKIIEERVPPLEMRWDPSARKKNLSDRKWHLREKWMAKKDVEERWPDAKLDQIKPDSMGDEEEWNEHDATEAWKYKEDQLDRFMNDKEDKILIIHFSYKEREAYYRVGDPETGKVLEFPVERFERLQDRLDKLQVPYVKQYRWVYKQKFLAGLEVLESGKAPVDDWTINPITAHREEGKNLWYGIVRAMKDPQMWANKFFAQIMHIFNTNPKGGLIYEKGAVDDTYDLEQKWADSTGIIEVEDGALTSGRIKEREMKNYPASLDKMLQFAISSIRDVSGMNVEMLGMADREQSGILEQERKKAALTILAPLANALRHYRKQQGRVLLKFMSKYIPNGTLVRVLEKGQEQYVPFTKDPNTHKYDVIVDTAQNSPNLKMEVWGTMSQMLPQLIQAGVPVPPALLDFSPLPESVVNEWKEYIESNSQLPKEVQQQLQSLQQENQKLQKEVGKLSDKREQSMLSMQQRREEAALEMQLEKEKAMLAARNKEMELAMKKQMSQEDLRIEILKIQTHYDVEIRKLQEKSECERTSQQMTAALKKEELDMTHKEKMRDVESEFQEKEALPIMDGIKKTGEAIEALTKIMQQKIESDDAFRKKVMKEVSKI